MVSAICRSPGVILKVRENLKLSLYVGIFSALGSLGWFTAFALMNAAYVKTVGQIELLFSILIGYFFFKEKITKLELCGMGLIVGSIILIIW